MPGTLHSWLMIIGLIIALPILIKKYCGAGIKLPFDYIAILILFLLIVFGFLLNVPTTTWLDFQAYVLMLVTYVYVKENTTTDTLSFLSSVIKYFLLINGLFVILQLLTGDYFPARFLAAGGPPLIIASGVSDGPTKNGMLISFGLSFMFAKFIFKRLSFSLFEGLTFLIGITSLLFASSRAGLLSFGVVVILGSIFALVQVVRNKQYKLSLLKVTILAVAVCAAFASIAHYALSFETLYDLRDPTADRYGLDYMVYKLTIIEDSSTEDRFNTIAFFKKQLSESPLHFLTVGFGPGTFETMYGLNIHNSYLELLFTTGVFGGLAFLFLIGHVMLKALSGRTALEIIPVVFALGSIMVFMATHDVLRGRMFWIPLAIISAFAYSNSRRGKAGLSSGVPVRNEDSSRYHRPE
jgi:O-antigen ligase